MSMMELLAILNAKYSIVLSVLIGGGFALKLPRDKRRPLLLFGLIALPLIYLTALIAGHLYYNPRPFVVGHFTPLIPHDPDNGFPSDHVLLVSAIAAVWSYFDRRVAGILWGIVVFIAISRVYVGVHHPIDVIASMLIAAAVSFLLYAATKRLKLLHLFDN